MARREDKVKLGKCVCGRECENFSGNLLCLKCDGEEIAILSKEYAIKQLGTVVTDFENNRAKT